MEYETVEEIIDGVHVYRSHFKRNSLWKRQVAETYLLLVISAKRENIYLREVGIFLQFFSDLPASICLKEHLQIFDLLFQISSDNGAIKNNTTENNANNNTGNNGNTNDATDGTDNRNGNGEGVMDEIGDDLKDGADNVLAASNICKTRKYIP